jgi:hypothetical protein
MLAPVGLFAQIAAPNVDVPLQRVAAVLSVDGAVSQTRRSDGVGPSGGRPHCCTARWIRAGSVRDELTSRHLSSSVVIGADAGSVLDGGWLVWCRITPFVHGAGTVGLGARACPHAVE